MHHEGDFEVMYKSPHQGSVRKPTKLTGLGKLDFGEVILRSVTGVCLG